MTQTSPSELYQEIPLSEGRLNFALYPLNNGTFLLEHVDSYLLLLKVLAAWESQNQETTQEAYLKRLHELTEYDHKQTCEEEIKLNPLDSIDSKSICIVKGKPKNHRQNALNVANIDLNIHFTDNTRTDKIQQNKAEAITNRHIEIEDISKKKFQLLRKERNKKCGKKSDNVIEYMDNFPQSPIPIRGSFNYGVYGQIKKDVGSNMFDRRGKKDKQEKKGEGLIVDPRK